MKKILLFTLMMLTLGASSFAQSTLTVADGTVTNQYVPVYGYYADAYLKCQVVYPAADLAGMTGGTITALTFYLSTTASDSWGSADFHVRLADQFAESTISAYSTATMTEVYSGSLDGTQSTMTVTFTTPFTYTGGNLLLEVTNETKGTYKDSYFYGITATGASVQGYSYSNLSSVSTYQRDFIPKTTFTYTPGGSGPICIDPTGLTASGETSDGATVSWTAPAAGESPLSYQVCCLPATATFDAATANWVAATGTTSHTFTGLNASTQYTAHVRSVCGSDFYSNGNASVNFNTACSSLTLPFNETFDASSSTRNCWNLVSMNTGNTIGTYYGMGFYTVEGREVLRFSSYSNHGGSNDYNQYGFSPLLDVSPTAAFLSVSVTFATYNSDNKLYFGYVTPTDTVWDSTEYTTTGSTDWQTQTFVIPVTATHLAVNYYGDYSFYAWIDNVSITEQTCSSPTGLHASVTSDEATIGWTDVSGNNVGYQAEWDGSILPVLSDNFFYYTGLTPASSHTVRVRTICAAGDTSDWSTPLTFTMECASVSTYPYSEGFDNSASIPVCWKSIDGDGDDRNWFIMQDTDGDVLEGEEPTTGNNYIASASFNYSTYSPLTPNNWLISPSFTLPTPCNLSLVWYAKSEEPPYLESLDLLLSTTGSDTAAFTTPVLSLANIPGEYTQYVYPLANYAGQTVRFAFVHRNVSGKSIVNLDNVGILEIPQVVTNDATNIDIYTASLNGSVTGQALTAFGFEWKASADSDYERDTVATGNHTGSISFNLANLDPATSYTFRTFAAVEGIIFYGDEKTFTTDQVPCPSPANLTVSNINSESATLTWTSQLPTTGSYKVYLNNTLLTQTPVSALTYPLTGLNPGTSYEVRVVTVCEGTEGLFDTKTFSTPCIRVGCFAIGDTNSTSSYYWLPVNTYYNYSYTQQLFLASEMGSANLITNIAFKYAYSSPTNKLTNVKIYMGHTTKDVFASNTDTVPFADLTEVYSGNLNCSQGWNTFELDQPFSYNGTDNLVLALFDNVYGYDGNLYQFVCATAGGDRALDYYSDSQVPDPANLSSYTGGKGKRSFRNVVKFGYCDNSTCVPPTVSVDNVTAHDAEVSWTPGYQESAWGMQYKGENDNDWTTVTLTPNSANPYTLTNLAANTNYTVQMWSLCGNNEVSNTTEKTFTTLVSCPAPTTLASTTVTATDATLSWTSVGTPGSFEVEYNDGENTLSTVVNAVSTTTQQTTTLTSLRPNTAYTVRVRAICGVNDISTWSNTASFTTLISCPSPTVPVVLDKTANSATISWTPVGTEGEWDVYYSWASPTDPTLQEGSTIYTITATSYTFTGLNANTTYSAHVRAVCGNGDVSDYVDVQFTTPCSSVSVPYAENFDSYTQGTSTSTTVPTGYPAVDMPACWTFLNNATTTSTYPIAFLTSLSTYAVAGNCLFFKSSSATPIYAVLPEMSENLSNLQLTFTYRNEGVSTFNGTLHVGYMTNLADASTYVEMYSCPQTTTKTEVEVNFNTVTVTPGTPYYIVFKYEGGSSNAYYLGIDNVSVDYIPACPAPTSLSASNETADGVTLTWTSVSTSGSFEVEYSDGENTFSTFVNAVATTSEQTTTLTGLSAITDYTVRVRVICGEGDTSTWSNTASFTTACAVLTAPHTEDFTGFNTLISACWERYSGAASSTTTSTSDLTAITSTTTGWIFGNQNVFGLGHAKLNIYGTVKSWLVTPAIDISTLTNPELTFDLALTTYNSTNPVSSSTTQADDKFIVFISTDNGATWSMSNATIWDNAGTGNNVYNNISTTGEKITIPLSQYAGQTIRIAFYGESTTSNGDNDVHIDNVSVDERPSCPVPTGVTVSNVTATTATLTWTPGGNENAWDIYVPSSSADVPVATPNNMISITATSYTVANLPSNSICTLYVRANCGNEESDWVIKTFTTLCGTVNIPYTENFEDYPANNHSEFIPCWNRHNTYSSNTSYPYISTNNPQSGSNALYFISSSSTYAMMVLPEVNLGNLQMSDLRVRFSMRPSNANAKMVVGVLTDPTEPSTFVPVDTVQNSAANTYEEHKVVLTNYSGQGRFVALRSLISGGTYLINVDDVTLEEKPACADITTLEVSGKTNSTATLTWTPGSSEAAWDLYLTTSTVEVPNAATQPTATATSPTHTFTMLSGNTGYTAYVRANCGDEGSDWVPVMFTTLCDPISLPYTENFDSYTNTGISSYPTCWQRSNTYSSSNGYPYINSAFAVSGNRTLYFYSSSPTYNLAVLPEFDLGNLQMTDLRVKFSMYPNNVNAKMIVGVMTDPADPSTFMPVDTVQNNAPSAHESHKVLLTNYTGNGRYVALKNYNVGGYYSIYLDDVVVEEIPSCLEIEDLAVTEVTNASATLSWTEMGTPSSYTVEYSLDNGATWTLASNTVTTSPYTITNLDPRTQYDARVFANCGQETSDTMYTSFATQCIIQGVLPIGEVGTNSISNCPFSSQWNYSLSEQLFTAAELGGVPNNLSAVSFYCTTTDYVTNRNWDVYLIAVPDTVTALSSFISLNNSNLSDRVFSGTVRIAGGWITVNFDNDYSYDGTSNLVLIVDDNTGDYNNSFYFAINPYTSGTRYAQNDDINIDPFNVSNVPAYVSNYRNVVKFTYCDNPSGCISPVVSVNPDSVTKTSAQVAWTLPVIPYQAMEMQYKPANGVGSQEVSTTFDFSQQGYENAYSLDGQTIAIDNNISFVANKSTGSTAPAYYNSGSALRIYKNNTFVVTAANGAVITGIEIEAVSSKHPNLNYAVDNGQSQNVNGSTHYVISDLTATTVSFTNPSSTQLHIETLTVHYAFSGNDWVNVDNTASPVVLTNLTPETEYMVRMRTVCDVRDTSAWSDTVRFTTAESCTPLTSIAVVPTSNTAEVTWTPADAETHWNVQYKSDLFINTNNTLVYNIIDHYADIESNILSGFNMDNNIQLKGTKDGGTTNPGLSSDNEELRLYYSSGGNGNYITLTPSTNAVITGLEMVASSTSYTPSVKYTVDGGTATAMNRSGTTYSLTGIQAQSSLKIQNVNTTNTQLRITQLTVYYTLSGDTSWHEVAGGVSTPTATLAGLVPNTQYTVRVQADCGNGDVSSWLSTGFTTECGVVIPPYAENFDNTNGALPDCWTNTNDNGTTDWRVVNNSNNNGDLNAAHSGSYWVQFFQGQKGHIASLQLPTFDLTGLTDPILKYWYANQKWSSDQDTLKVYYRTSPTEAWTLLATHDADISMWTLNTLLLPNPSATYQIKFQGVSSWGYGINLDDVSVEETPICIAPSDLAVTEVTSTGATIMWTAGGSETSWDVYLSNTPNDVPTANTTPAATTNSATYTFTGLTNLTEYTAYVRANCGGLEGVSSWESIAFKTGTFNMKIEGWDTLHTCDMRVYDNGGANGNYANYSNSYLVIYPDAAGSYVQVSGSIIAESSMYDSLIIYDGAGITAPLFRSNHSSYTLANIPTITSTTGPLTIHFGSDHSLNSDGFELLVSCVTCPAPTSLAVSELAPKAATITWTAGSTETAWDVYLSNTPNDVPTATPTASASSTTYTFTGLTESTAYTAYVRANCGSGDVSDWVSVNFTTEDLCVLTNAITASACGSYQWNDSIYTRSGTYVQTFHTPADCDSVVTLTLTINNPVHASVTEVACGSYTWNNTEYTQSGTYTYPHQDANGCTQVDTLHLTVNPIPVVTVIGDAAIALYESATLMASGASTYLWSTGETTQSITVTPTSIGNHTYTVVGTSNNCQSVPDTFVVEVGACRPGVSTETVTACDSYEWHGTTYTQSTNNATYRIPNGAVSGCDSVITLHLTILNSKSSEFTVTNCINYEWNNQVYTTSGDYVQTFEAANGCDSTVTLHLTINQPVTKTVNIVDCDSYTWIDQTFTTSGDYTRTFTAANGCDSVVTLHLTIKKHVTHEITATNCGSYTWNNEVYETSGDYEQIFPAANGCDSVVTLHLTVNPVYDQTVNQAICAAALPYHWRDTTFAAGTESGTFVFHRQTTAGCDSTVTLHLVVNDAITTEVTETGCVSYTWNNQVYTTSGDYVQTLQTAAGCDSTVTMHLSIFNPVHEAFTVVNCGPYLWNNTEYPQSGTYTYAHEDAHGCTQVDTLHLTVKPVPVVTITNQSGLPIIAYGESETLIASGADSYVWNTQQTTPVITVAPRETSVYSVVGTTDGCSSDTVSITVNVGNCVLILNEFSATGCGSYTWNNTVYTTSGDYQQLLQNDLGCDSLVTLHLTIYPQHGETRTVDACGSYDWYQITYTQSGTYTFSYYDGNGCIQTDTLHLTIHNPVNEVLTIVNCGPYLWHNTEYTESGTYTYTYQNVYGCTLVDTLYLTVKPVPVVTVSSNNTQIVQHESTTLMASGATSYVWSNQATGASVTVTPMQTTTYSVVGTVDGCASEPDSITVYVTPCTPAEGVFTVTACNSYRWYGTLYTESTNTATHAIQRPGICDSIVTLHLTILHPVARTFDITACESYTWNNTLYRQSGTYTYAHPDANGCTQVDTLHLTIIHPTHTAVTVSECNAFTWHNTVYTQSGTYTFAFTDYRGCTQVDTLHLTIFHPAHTAYNVDACDSYVWNNVLYTQSGTYTYRHRDANGCQQIDTLHLTIHHPVAQSYEAVACESYTWNNTVYTQSGTYTYAHEDAHGCMQVDTLHLTIHNAVAESFEAEVCESYTWNNTVYTQSGTYTYAHADANGCTQVDTLHLTVHHAVAEVVDITACESYLWNNTEYTQSGTYTFTHADAHGCTQVDTLHLIINNPTHAAVTESACGSYTWNGTVYTQSGVYTNAHADANGCTQVDTLHLTIFQPAATEFSAHACGSYYWNNVYYDQTGDYVQHFQTVDGCDSAVTLHLTIHPRAEVAGIVGDTIIHEFESTTLTATATAGNVFWVGYGYTPSITVSPMQTTTYSVMSISEYCASTPVRVTVRVLPCIPVQGVETVTACESYEWHGVTYTESTNTPTFTIERQGVCDSIVTLHLTILRPTHVAYTEGACGSYVWNNTEYTQSGTYTFAHADDNGCTQVDTLHLTIYNPTHEAFTVSECNAYTWNNTVYTQSGTYTYVHDDVHGCTQVDTLHLTIYNPVAETFEAEACGSYIWNNTEYTQSGDFTYAHTDVHGCTQVDTLHLTIYNSTHVAYTESACGSYVWNNTEYTQSGDYTYAHQDAHGCTQVDTLHLTILNAVHEAFTVSECNAYTWHNVEYTQSGTYTFIHSDANGCTKVDTLHLTIFHPQPNVYTLTTCGDYVWHGTVYTQSGDYTYTTTDINGCTQVDTLHLIVVHPQNTSSTAEACGSYVWRGNTYTQSGVYVKAVQDNFGCMYQDTLYLTIHTPVETDITETACESYTWNNVTYTQSGHYVQHFLSMYGCDSTVTLHLTVYHPVHQSVTAGECGPYTWHGTTYTQSGAYTYAHSDANGCTQVDTLHLIIYQPLHQSLRITECESFTWGGTTYTQSGVYTYAHSDNHGCTQVDTLYLTINHPTGTSITVTECEVYDWNGFIYTQSGTYTQSHLDNNGCTQVDTLRLTIYHPVHQSVTVSDCYEYTWHGTTYNFSGVYTYAHLDNHGCTQVDTLHLTLYHPQSSTITVDACGSYQWHGTNYTQSGVYTHNATSTYGCQVVDTLILHIHQSVTTTVTETACSYYVWDGTVYTQSGTYVKHFFTPWGCDSVVTLHLDIHQPQSSEFTVTTENSCYTWNGIDYCQSGTYMQSFEDQYGCDSTVVLHLTLRVGISEFDDYAVSLYPNPTTGVTYVEVSGDEMESVEVYDAYGKLLQTMKVSGNVTQLELSAYATGTYYVRVTTTKGVVTKRVIKN